MKSAANVSLIILLGVMAASCSRQHYKGPLSPEEELKTFHLQPGFKAELFAAEPFIQSPVSMAFDARGNVYVAEMPDYPDQPEPGKGQGKIVLLRDTNNDGRVDQSVVFADGLSDPTSMLPWKGGLLVTAAPDILYLKDTTGDGRADIKEVLFSGFFVGNSEAQITSLRFGIDNWIYASNDGEPGGVKFTKDPDAPPLSMAGSDFRFRLDRNKYELATGSAQFGQSIDDWGHRFLTQNTFHIREAVIPRRYMERNPYLPSSVKDVTDISDHGLLMYQLTPTPYWREVRTERRNQAYQEQHLDRVEYARDHFTAASGGTIYAGDLFPPEYYGNVFTGDVSGSLVHRDILIASDSSPVFIATRGKSEKSREFLASTDPWCRPASFAVGPDGALYVIDMYRQHIETPVSIPDDLKKEMNFKNGVNRGRIFRIVPENAKPSGKPFPDLEKMSSPELTGLLAHPNRWYRLEAQRLLLERQDHSVVPSVKKLFAESRDPRCRLHALYVLEGLNALDPQLVIQAMKDPAPGVRENGMKLSEQYPQCFSTLLNGINDPSPRGAFQAALSLGNFPADKTIPAFAKVIEKHGEDPWFRTAVLSSGTGSSPALLKQLLDQGAFFSKEDSGKIAFVHDLSYVVGARRTAGEITQLLNLLFSPSLAIEKEWQAAGLAGLSAGWNNTLNKHLPDLPLQDLLNHLSAGASGNIKEALQHFGRQVNDSTKTTITSKSK